MSERKVLNKYFPPDYDPSNIPKLAPEMRERKKQFAIRTMIPFNMRCNTCGEYIRRATKFNSKMENAEGLAYLGIGVKRFYIRCPRCCAEITFLTDPENIDYKVEHGATRMFEALRAKDKEDLAKLDAEEKAAESNAMAELEKRTAASQREMEQLEQLAELREINIKNASVAVDTMLSNHYIDGERIQEKEDDELEAEVRKAFNIDAKGVKRLDSSSSEDEQPPESSRKRPVIGSMPVSLPTKKPVTGGLLGKLVIKPKSQPPPATTSSSKSSNGLLGLAQYSDDDEDES